MKLYYFRVAPNPTKVRLYLAEKAAGGAEIPIEPVSVNLVAREQKTAEHLARNPFGRLPVLELDDGSFLTESLAIIEYLEELFPEPPMIGSSALERARVREVERIAESGLLLHVAMAVHATNSPLGLPPSPQVAEGAKAGLPRYLKEIDRRLADGRPFVAGDNPTIADCTMQAALQFARFGKIEIDPRYEHVARWDREYRGRPAVQAVLTL
jgi:glutathione S-transferase